MHQISKRVKANIPAVVLTMLGIIQAFALELLWNYVSGTALLYSMTWQAFMSWTQVVIILVGIIAIWLVYACNVSRFVWVPSIQEFVLPFWVGLMQFMLIQLLDRALDGAVAGVNGFFDRHHDLDWASHHAQGQKRS